MMGESKPLKIIENSEVENLDWFHPHADRHVAETLLLQNGHDGTYLLRRRDKHGSSGHFALSVRSRDAVKHFEVNWDGSMYRFGMATFPSLQEFANHFRNRPLVAGESGVLTVLKHPYPKKVDEPNMYDCVKIHAEFGKAPYGVDSKRYPGSTAEFSSCSKSGYLTKLGGRVKNWKTRWFSLLQHELRYFKHSSDKDPIRNLDLRDCTECLPDKSLGKDNCFRLVFSWRTFYLYATTEEDAAEWLGILQWKVKKLSGTRFRTSPT